MWLGPNGRAWNEPPADRHDAVRRIGALTRRDRRARESDCGAGSRLPWSGVSYTGHKEVVLRQPLEWFEALAANVPSAWDDDGLRLLAISREASRVGDNRLSWEVDDAVLTAACITGPGSVSRLARNPNGALSRGSRSLVSGLLAMTKTVSVSREDVLAIWAFCTGQLCWQLESDGHRLADARVALVGAAARIGAADVATLMDKLAPAEFACEPQNRDAASEYSRDYTALANVSVNTAMNDMCGDARDWTGVNAIVLERLVRDGAADASVAITRAWAALSFRHERMWFFDGSTRVYTAIFPLLSSAQRWDVVQLSVMPDVVDAPEFRAATLAENLDDLCRLAAVSESAVAVRDGLRRLLAMHELWITGSGRLPPLAPLEVAGEDVSISKWGAPFTEVLFQSLALDQQAYVQAALRGLDRLLTVDSTLYEDVIVRAQAAHPEVQRRLLFIAEELSHRPDAGAFRGWLTVLTESSRLDVALSAWAALRFGARGLGENAPDWQQSDRQRSRARDRGAPAVNETFR